MYGVKHYLLKYNLISSLYIYFVLKKLTYYTQIYLN